MMQQPKWIDRFVTALFTLLIGASAQGLLSWREIGVLSMSVTRMEAREKEEHEAMLSVIDDISRRQRDVVLMQATLVERVEATRESLREHKEDRKDHR